MTREIHKAEKLIRRAFRGVDEATRRERLREIEDLALQVSEGLPFWYAARDLRKRP